MIIHSRIKNYEVNILSQFPKANSFGDKNNVFYVIDKNVYNIYPALFEQICLEHLFIFDSIEQNKTINYALEICEKILRMNAKRNIILISYGGGIVQDVTGFVANIMYRGIRWIFVPTTLLSACDSCIGSKTSLNYKTYKNLFGTFYPPDDIYICSNFFKTLTEYDYQSGLGEILKFNIMIGSKGIETIENTLPLLLKRDSSTINQFVEASLFFKKYFIEKDEFDKGIRILLNYAHTFGHAIEVSSTYHIPHGSAVAMGILIANHISERRKILTNELKHRIEKLILPILTLELQPEWFDVDIILNAIRKDKKQTNYSLTAILLKNNFELEIIHDLSENEIIESISYFKELIKLFMV